MTRPADRSNIPRLARNAEGAFRQRQRVHVQQKESAMAARKTKKKAAAPVELIISKSRTKGAVKKCNVSSEFYAALDAYVRAAIKGAEERATGNGRKTLRPYDL